MKTYPEIRADSRDSRAHPLIGLIGAAGAVVCALTVVTAMGTAAPTTIRWERHAYALPESIWSVESFDANGDGKKDLIAMGVTKVWALVAPDWKEHVILDIKEGKILYCVAIDVNRDGAVDLALGRYATPWIDFRTARAASKTVPEPTGPDFSVAWIENSRRVAEPWTLHVVDRERNGIHGICVGDVDGDGHPDLISDSISGPFFPNSLAWFCCRRAVPEQWNVTSSPKRALMDARTTWILRM